LYNLIEEPTTSFTGIRRSNDGEQLIHGIREHVLLQEVDSSQRAPILKAYLQLAPGARPHIPIDKDAPLADFEKIASQYPVFKLDTIK
jgi:hypothetical protein